MNRKIDRRDFIKSMSAVTTGAFLAGTGSRAEGKTAVGEKGEPRPNVLLYVVDDQGTNDAGCYGNKLIRTPGLDELAGEGVRFGQAFCTTASCSASRSVILSGYYNHANGQFGHAHSFHHFKTFDKIKTLPVFLKEAGYRTARWGKYHVAPEEVYPFDEVIKAGAPVKGADNCRVFIEEDRDKPFFLYFCTTEPHRPFSREGSKEVSPEEVIVPDYLPDTPECREELAKYYGSVERADSGLRELMKILKETGQWENTLVIYCSDNGIAFPGAKTTLYEPGMRLPFVVKPPHNKDKGKVTDAMINYTYITPTILDYAGAIPGDYKFQGRSFRGVLERGESSGFDEVYASHTFHEITMYYPMRVVRTRRYKLTWNIAYELEYPFATDLWASKTWQGVIKRKEKYYGKRSVDAYLHRAEFELYDLKEDPHEINNLAGKPEYKGKLAELKKKLKDFQKRTDDPWILKWDYE
jgi:N-sulfoglucosamine sulfohydrolase